MKIYMLEPGKDLRSMVVANDLKLLQDLVGGYLEAFSIQGGPVNTILLCDEEGKLKGKQPNIMIPGDVIVGTVLFVGSDHRGEFVDCPMSRDEILAKIRRCVTL